MTTAHIKWYIVNKVHQLTNDEKIHILNTLKKKVTYTKNKNDYLFNLNKISEDDLQNVYEIIKLILENRETIHKMRQLRLEKEAEFKRLIEETLEKRKEKEKSDYKENLMVKDFFDKNYKGESTYIRYTTRPVEMNVRLKYRNIQDPDERIRKGNEETKKVYSRYKKLLINLKTNSTSIQWKSAMESDTEEEYDEEYDRLESEAESKSESKSESSDSESSTESESSDSESSESEEPTDSDDDDLESLSSDESESESISDVSDISEETEKTKRYSDANSQDSKLEYLRQKLHEMGVKLESMTPYLVKQEYTFEF